jgi:hypothetical protein
MGGTLPSWMGKDRRTKQNKTSRGHEKRIAKATGGRVQPGSGSSWRARQDTKDSDQLIQHKGTDKASFTIKVDEWKEIQRDADRAGREPVLVITFQQHGIELAVTAADIPD